MLKLYAVGILRKWDNNYWTYRLKIPQHFQVYAEQYASDQEAFFKDYAEAHAKLSSLGSKFDPAEVSAIPRIVFQHSAVILTKPLRWAVPTLSSFVFPTDVVCG
jgi:hypothetical protein